MGTRFIMQRGEGFSELISNKTGLFLSFDISAPVHDFGLLPCNQRTKIHVSLSEGDCLVYFLYNFVLSLASDYCNKYNVVWTRFAILICWRIYDLLQTGIRIRFLISARKEDGLEGEVGVRSPKACSQDVRLRPELPL